MSKVDGAWTCADLSKAVCDELVFQGLLKEKPAFIRFVLRTSGVFHLRLSHPLSPSSKPCMPARLDRFLAECYKE